MIIIIIIMIIISKRYKFIINNKIKDQLILDNNKKITIF